MLKIWHRWASGYELENTLQSFTKAINLWVDMIELDIRLCASGELIVCHDDDLSRLLDVDQDIYMLIPTLIQVLDLINRKTKINIEIKHISAVEPLIRLLTYYVADRGWQWEDFLISSFDHYAIRLAKELEPSMYIWALVEWVMIWYSDFAEKLWCYSLHMSIDFVNQQLVDDAHARWLQVYIYTCNTAKQIARCYELWVDGVISDYPDRII